VTFPENPASKKKHPAEGTMAVPPLPRDAIACLSDEAGPGAIFFAAVVVLTMFAAMSFDPRMIWDIREQTRDSIGR